MKGRDPRQAAGRDAEDLAVRYLAAQGLEIVGRNIRVGRGEIDIVAREGEEIVFVEVRARRGRWGRTPEETLDRGKRGRLVRAAAGYVARHGLGDVPCRFDLVAVRLLRGGARELRHYRSAFVDGDR